MLTTSALNSLDYQALTTRNSAVRISGKGFPCDDSQVCEGGSVCDGGRDSGLGGDGGSAVCAGDALPGGGYAGGGGTVRRAEHDRAADALVRDSAERVRHSQH